MADILRGYGLAREQAHFKLEQEADVQRRRQRLIKEGKLPKEERKEQERAEAEPQAGAAPGFGDSMHDYEVGWGARAASQLPSFVAQCSMGQCGK